MPITNDRRDRHPTGRADATLLHHTILVHAVLDRVRKPPGLDGGGRAEAGLKENGF